MTQATHVSHAGGERIRIEQHSIAGMLWFGSWLFTVAFLKLSFWKAVLAVLVWPYFIGVALRLPSP